MASLGFAFKADEYEDRLGEFPVFPAGQYKLQALQSEVEDNKNQNGKNVWFEFEIMEGDFQGSTFRHYINNMVHPSDQAQEIARREFKELCVAVGQYDVAETEAVHFIPFSANLKLIPAGTVTKRKGKEDYVQKNAKNEIAKYEALAVAQPARAQAQRPVAQAQRPVAQPAQRPVAQPTRAPAARPQAAGPWATPRNAPQANPLDDEIPF